MSTEYTGNIEGFTKNKMARKFVGNLASDEVKGLEYAIKLVRKIFPHVDIYTPTIRNYRENLTIGRRNLGQNKRGSPFLQVFQNFEKTSKPCMRFHPTVEREAQGQHKAILEKIYTLGQIFYKKSDFEADLEILSKSLLIDPRRVNGNGYLPDDYENESPKSVILSGFVNDPLDEDKSFNEGTMMQVLVNRFERSKEARQKCIEIHGSICSVCSVDFNERYGSEAQSFIHVHHKIPLSQIRKGYVVDPEKDLIPVCPNCHVMLHKLDCTSEELKKRFIGA